MYAACGLEESVDHFVGIKARPAAASGPATRHIVCLVCDPRKPRLKLQDLLLQLLPERLRDGRLVQTATFFVCRRRKFAAGRAPTRGHSNDDAPLYLCPRLRVSPIEAHGFLGHTGGGEGKGQHGVK